MHTVKDFLTRFFNYFNGVPMSEDKKYARVNKAAVITIVCESNPKNKNTKGFERFALYESGMTVADYLAKGGKAGDIRYDAKKGYISLAE